MVQQEKSHNCSSIHSQPLLLLHSGSRVLLEPIPAVLGQRQSSPRRNCQLNCIIGRNNNKSRQPINQRTFTRADHLQFSISLLCMSLDSGRKLEKLERTHADTRKRSKVREMNRQPSSCEAPVLTTAPLSLPL